MFCLFYFVVTYQTPLTVELNDNDNNTNGKMDGDDVDGVKEKELLKNRIKFGKIFNIAGNHLNIFWNKRDK